MGYYNLIIRAQTFSKKYSESVYLRVCILRTNLSDEIARHRKRHEVITLIGLYMSLTLPCTPWTGIPLLVQRERGI